MGRWVSVSLLTTQPSDHQLLSSPHPLSSSFPSLSSPKEVKPTMRFFLIRFFALFVLARPTWSFVILQGKILVTARMDPIVQPGAVSSHVHNVVGGNKFKSTYNADDLMTSSCTTMPVMADLSNYWAPAMYYIDWSLGSSSPRFTHLASGFNIYYLRMYLLSVFH